MSSRAPIQRFVPSPPPAVARGGADSEPARGTRARAATFSRDAEPPLPSVELGTPPGRPPGVSRPAPRVGGMRGMSEPPEIRRRMPGGTKSTPEARDAADRIRAALRKSQRKLLGSKSKLEASVAALRALLLSRR